MSLISEFYTEEEKAALERHASIRQATVTRTARELADKAALLRITLGASPDLYTGWLAHLERAKKDMDCILERFDAQKT